jgi:hypothetical protein
LIISRAFADCLPGFRLSTDILDGKDHNAMASWVTTFCRSSPQATIREASQQLVAALSRNEIK